MTTDKELHMIMMASTMKDRLAHTEQSGKGNKSSDGQQLREYEAYIEGVK